MWCKPPALLRAFGRADEIWSVHDTLMDVLVTHTLHYVCRCCHNERLMSFNERRGWSSTEVCTL